VGSSVNKRNINWWVQIWILIIIAIRVKLIKIVYELLRCNVTIWAHKKQLKQQSKFSPLKMPLGHFFYKSNILWENIWFIEYLVKTESYGISPTFFECNVGFIQHSLKYHRLCDYLVLSHIHDYLVKAESYGISPTFFECWI
jgi:hypothetical protein